jgi:RecJ-like exonuclease
MNSSMPSNSGDNWYPGIPMTRPARDNGVVVSDCRRKVPIRKKKKEAPADSQLALNIDVEYMKPVLCPECRGMGRIKSKICYQCRGNGVIPNEEHKEAGQDDSD